MTIEVQRAVRGPLRLELASRVVHGPLSASVRRLNGYAEVNADGPTTRDELPGARVVVIVEHGPPLSVSGLERQAGRGVEGGFIAGLSHRPTTTRHEGAQRGVQLDLRPTAARRLIGQPVSELMDRVVSLVDIWGEDAPPSRPDWAWRSRLDQIETWLGRRLELAPAVDRRMVWAEEQLLRSGGQARIEPLWRELGMSERRFIARFTEAVGTTPKRFARLCGFERICAALRGPDRPLTDVALDVGCYDQPHLCRETRSLAGLTPAALRASLSG